MERDVTASSFFQSDNKRGFDWRSPCIMELTSPSELKAIGRLRYDQYIVGHESPYAANHDQKIFIDRTDQVSRHFVAKQNEEICSALRLTRVMDATEDEQLTSLIEACAVPLSKRSKTVINSRFTTRPRLAARRQIIPLFQFVYAAGLKIGAELCLLSTRSELTNLFTRFGFKPKCVYCDPIVGERVAMILDAYDFVHMESINSPYLKVARAELSAEFFNEAMRSDVARQPAGV